MNVVEGLAIRFQPDEEKLKQAREFGENFAKKMSEE
jgi:hypothetical protein